MTARRRIGAALAVCLALTASACSSSSSPHGGAASSSSGPSTAPPASDVAEIYAAALGSRSAVASRMRRVTYLIGHFCTGMVDIARRGPCRAGAIPPDLQRQLRELVGPNLHITDDPPAIDPRQRFPRALIVQFGTVVVHDNSARLAVDYRCGPTCGRGDTLLLSRTGGRWRVTGRTGPAWTS